MSRYAPLVGLVLTAVLIGSTGCQPQQPFYFHQVDEDLAHYKGVATEISVPDVDTERLNDVALAKRPFSLENMDPKNFWDMTLEEAIEIALHNSKVIRSSRIDILATHGGNETMYSPALAEANPHGGVEAALSAFDAQFQTALQWQRTNTPENVNPLFTEAGVFANISEHDIANFQAQLSKVTATGGQFAISHTVAYDMDRFAYAGNAPYNFASDWNVKLEASMRQPLFQGAGVQFNRIAGPGAQPGAYNGVILARISTDIAVADLEADVRNLVKEVEDAYWLLQLSYRTLDTAVAGRDAALQTWRTTHTLNRVGSKGGEAEKESTALQNYYAFKLSAEAALGSNGMGIYGAYRSEQNIGGVYYMESQLRYLLGIAATDGRLIRPKDEPLVAKVSFDWNEVLNEGLARSVELRRKKSEVKAREMELIAAKNFLLPKVDFVALYRWLGLGNDLLPVPDGAGGDFMLDRSNAYQSLTSGAFQEWQVGLQANIPLGYRKEMAGVRHAQLSLAREQARLQEEELALSHELSKAIGLAETDYVLTQTAFNQRNAAQRELDAVNAAYQTDTVTIDRVLDAQQKLALAQGSYYSGVVNYVLAIANIHFHKGSLLEYNDVYLAEGPWPAKAYFDATRRTRAREASTYMDYGFTQPRVMSRGPLEQMPGGITPENVGEETIVPTATPNSTPNPKPTSKPREPELVPTPEPEPLRSQTTSTVPVAPLPEEKSGAVTLAGAKENRGWNAVMTIPSAAKKADRQVGDDWISVEKASYNEPSTNPPAAPVDRPASGWKGIQR